LEANRFVVGFGCSSLTDANKNFPAFVEVLERLSRETNVEALVFGDGFEKCRVGSAKVHSLGKLSSAQDLSLAYSAMDVFVMTSGIETFGQVALEAQACGTPVCAFEVGGLNDAVRHGATGFLSPPGNSGTLASNISTLYESESLRRSFADEGFAWSRKTFTPESAKRAYMELYREAMETMTRT
jgi:glycosyltransferase involved in cell wall biosynthesis